MKKASPVVKVTLFSVVVLAAFVLGFKLGHSVLSQHSVAGLNRTSKQYRLQHSKKHSEMMHGQHGSTGHSMHGMTEMADGAALGLHATDDSGLQLHLKKSSFPASGNVAISFQIRSQNGKAVRSYDVEHEKKLHLIIASKDLTHFYHLHPTIDANGWWKTSLKLNSSGNYRLFADFVTAGKKHVLATDLIIAGYAPYPTLPKLEQVAHIAGGYTVRLRDVSLHAKSLANVKFDITKAGKPVKPEPFLGAGGHLVALRFPDLAYLHTHPLSKNMSSSGHDDMDEMGNNGHHGMASKHHNHSMVHGQARSKQLPTEIFQLTFPSAARYRLFFQFKVAGKIYTAPLTVAVEK